MTEKRLTRIDLPGIGALRLDWADDWKTGTTIYQVTAPRVTGSFSLTLDLIRTDLLQDHDSAGVYVTYGRGAWWTNANTREDPPIVNGVQLRGGTVVHAEQMRKGRLRGRDVNVRRAYGRWNDGPAPDATQERTAAVIHGIAAHWLTRTDHYPLRLAAVRHRACQTTGQTLSVIAKEELWLAEAVAALNRAQEEAAYVAKCATMPPAQLDTATTPPNCANVV